MHVKGSENGYLPYSTSEDHKPVLLLCAVLVAVLGAVERGPSETTDRSRWFET